MKFMQYVIGLLKELVGLFRVSKEAKVQEVQLKNKEEFKAREIKQQEVVIKDRNEDLIDKVVNPASETQRQISLQEIRKIISK